MLYRKLFAPAERHYHQFLGSEEPIIPAALRTLRLDYRCLPEDLLCIPPTGPVILVANHPYGGMEVPVLAAMLSGIRQDFKFMATAAAMFIPPARQFFIPIARHRGPRAVDANCGSIRGAIEWLRSGGLVVVFPAGVIATRPVPAFRLTEQPWTDLAVILARWSNAPVVPVFLHGCNHWTFYAANLLHRDLPYLALIWQGMRHKLRVIRISIGTPIQARPLIEQSGLKQATEHLRLRTLALRAIP